MTLKDRVCIVTGATSGMGKAIATTLHSEGAKLVLSGQNAQRGQALRKALSGSVFAAGDVSDADYNKKLVETAIDTFGKLNVLVLSAGRLGLGSVLEVPISEWQKTLDVNLNAIFYLSKYAIPHLQNSAASSILINSSIAAYKSFPNHPAYCASKAATLALMRQMAVEYAPQIRVNALCPGPVDTPMIWDSAKAFPNPTEAVENAGKATLMKRLGTPEDVAKLARFLISDEASWITGTAITIDGGILNS